MSTRVIVNNADVEIRTASAVDGPSLYALIAAHREEGRLLPRTLDELCVHASRFVVAIRRGVVVGCAELAPLSKTVAEVRSLAVDGRARGSGLGLRIVDEIGRRARIDGYTKLCAFAHAPGFFVRLGFSIVPHRRIPEKIAHDCVACAHFIGCGQHALVLELHASVPRHGPAPRVRTVARSRRAVRTPMSAQEGPGVR